MDARIVLALAVTLCAPALCTSTSAQGVSPRSVLVIHSGAETFPSNPILDEGIRGVLTSRSDVPINTFSEYWESDLFPGEEASRAFTDYIRRKYQGSRIDVVIVITDAALRLVLNHRGELFPDAPIVFLSPGVDRFRHAIVRGGFHFQLAVARLDRWEIYRLRHRAGFLEAIHAVHEMRGLNE